jgi:hypothetical protein
MAWDNKAGLRIANCGYRSSSGIETNHTIAPRDRLPDGNADMASVLLFLDSVKMLFYANRVLSGHLVCHAPIWIDSLEGWQSPMQNRVCKHRFSAGDFKLN